MYYRNPLYQSAVWRRFQENLGVQTVLINNVVVLIKKLPFGKTFLEVQRVNLTSEDFSALAALARQKNSVFLRISPNAATLPPFLQSLARTTGAHRFPECTLMINLAQSEEEILANMSQSGRRHLRKAREASVKIQETRDIKPFMPILAATTARNKFFAHDGAYYQKLLDALGEDAFLLLAEYDNKVVAGGIFAYSGDICLYLYGASLDEYRDIQAPTLLQWEAISRAKKAGKKLYDFLGVAPQDAKNHPWQGVSQFKRKFGGTEVVYAEEVEIPFFPWWDYFFRFMRRIRRLLRSFR